MTEQEIEEVIQSAILNAETVEYDRACTPKDHADTAAEIADLERLGAFAKAAREIVQAVSAYGYDTGGECGFCGKGILHAPDCPVTKARALLADHT